MIPESLKALPRWVNWVKKAPHGKIPLQHCDKPETWMTYEDALSRTSREPFVGLGIQLGVPLVGIDLDWKSHVHLTPFSDIPDYAREIIESQDSYTEWSPSGLGCHILCSGRIDKAVKTKNIEVYGEGRFFTVTGRAIRESAVSAYRHVTERTLSEKSPVVLTGERDNRLWNFGIKVFHSGCKTEESIYQAMLAFSKNFADPDIDLGKTRDKARRIAAGETKDTVDVGSARVLSHRDLIELVVPERAAFAITGDGTQILTAYSLNQVFAFRGTGKTLFQMAWAMALASGRDFLCYMHPEPRRVLYIEGELPTTLVQHRIKALARPEDLSRLSWLTRDAMPLGFYLDVPACRDFITQYVADNKTEVIFLDSSQSLLMRPENEEETWMDIAPWLVHLRTLGCCVIFTRQTGKDQGRGARGHSRAEDLLDVSIQLTQLDPGAGYLNAKLEYTKFRGTGDIRPIMIEKPVSGGWSFKNTEDDLAEEVISMAKDGKSHRAIAKELGIRPERVGKILGKTRESTGLF